MKLTKTNQVLINSIEIVASQIGYKISREEIEKMSKEKANELFYKLRVMRG